MALTEPKSYYLPFKRGLDLVTPSWETAEGTCRQAQNFEVGINSGYQTVVGYESFDGRPSPSDANYSIFAVTITGTIAVGNTITGTTSSATAVVLLVNGTTELVITKILGTFTATETLEVAASVEATATAVPIQSGASTPDLNGQYKNLAADNFRADIGVPTGSGDTLGLAFLNDILYAFRNNAGGTAAGLFKSSTSGWTAVALGLELSYTSGGVYETLVGNTITGATSAATAVITGVTVETGTFAAGTAAGRFIFASQTGTFQAEDLNVGANLNVATIAADSSAITLSPGGKYETVNSNFGGQLGTRRIYGVDGVNRGFEFDSTTFIPIATGSTVDTPSHVVVHKNHLFYAFNSSAQHSAIGDPYNFTIIEGAAELALGDDISAFKVQTGADGKNRLAMFAQNSIHVLYGTDSTNWDLIKYKEEVGANVDSVQEVGDRTLFYDARGIVDLNTTIQVGNFQHFTISELVQPFITSRRTLTSVSTIVREKNQYRLFFSDKSALYVTYKDNQLIGIMPIAFSDKVISVLSIERNDGSEAIYFGSESGKVFQMEKGTSFDGEAIETFMFTHFYHQGMPRRKKRYHNITIETSGAGFTTFNFRYELAYGSTDVAQPQTQTTELSFSSVFWDAFTWDAFFWDGKTLAPSRLKMFGSGENVSVIIRSNSDYYTPLKLSGAILHATTRE